MEPTQLPSPASSPGPATRTAPLPPPPDGAVPLVDTVDTVDTVERRDRPPRVGDLTTGWHLITLFTWVGVIMALAAVWNASVQLGLPTWWLGQRAQPRPRIVQLSPFIAPMLMLLATINQIRWLGWCGLVASGVVAGYGVGELGRVDSLAFAQLSIAALAAGVSLASLAHTYRPTAAPFQPPAP